MPSTKIHSVESPTNPLEQTLNRALTKLFARRDMLKISGRGMGYSALATSMLGISACGGGNSSDHDPQDDEEILEDPGPIESSVIPAPTSEFTVLKRTSFGVQKTALAEINSAGIDSYLEQQLDYTSINDGNLETTISTQFPLSQQTAAELFAGFPDNIPDVVRDMVGATQYRQMFSKRQLYEVMVEFWSDHFNIHLLNGLEPTLKPADDLNVIREHALGNFRDLLHASSKSPAMLFYLDSFDNFAGIPNENYARELMELHTLGVDGGYTETDVQEVARCFTGWSINFPGQGEYGIYNFREEVHDNGVKHVLGNVIAAGGGRSDGEIVIDLLAGHPATAAFIATKLCRRFISDSPASEDINIVAAAFSAHDGDIKNTLRELFQLDSFRQNPDLKISRPSEYLAQVIRALLPTDNYPDDAYPTDNGTVFYYAQSLLGQLPFFWSTPDGYPDTTSYWSSTSGLLNRWRLAFLSYAGAIPELNIFSVDYVALINGANTLSEVTTALCASVLMRELSNDDHDYIVNSLAETFTLTPTTELTEEMALAIAPLITALLISSVYFQLK